MESSSSYLVTCHLVSVVFSGLVEMRGDMGGEMAGRWKGMRGRMGEGMRKEENKFINLRESVRSNAEEEWK